MWKSTILSAIVATIGLTSGTAQARQLASADLVASNLMVIPVNHADCTPDMQPATQSNQGRWAMGVARIPAPAAGPVMMTKSRAILGGQVSKLDQMRLVQNGGQAMFPAPVMISVAAPVIFSAPATADNFVEQGQCGTAPRNFVPNYGPDYGDTSEPDFTPMPNDAILGSRAISVGKTPFDGAWARVNNMGSTHKIRQNLAATGALAVSDVHQRVARVNKWVNDNIAFSDDRRLYKRADYWASATETFARRAGDCEDFAIAKMQLLSAMGISKDKMRLVVARDIIRNADHAVLIVELDHGPVLLDNATNLLLDARLPHGYRPIMSFTQNRKWVHGYAAAPSTKWAQASKPPVNMAQAPTQLSVASVAIAMANVPSTPLTVP